MQETMKSLGARESRSPGTQETWNPGNTEYLEEVEIWYPLSVRANVAWKPRRFFGGSLVVLWESLGRSVGSLWLTYAYFWRLRGLGAGQRWL